MEATEQEKSEGEHLTPRPARKARRAERKKSPRDLKAPTSASQAQQHPSPHPSNVREDTEDTGGVHATERHNEGTVSTFRHLPASRHHVVHTGPQQPIGDVVPFGGFPFRVNYNDHFETQIEALQDLLPVLNLLRSLIRPNSPEKFTLYDPYYCAGAIRALWNQLGYSQVIHEKRDFYEDIQNNEVPVARYDICVTNPPYSGDHIENFVEFCVGSNKPWAMLVPDYVPGKEWYRKIIAQCFAPHAGGIHQRNDGALGSYKKPNQSVVETQGSGFLTRAGVAIPRMMPMPSVSVPSPAQLHPTTEATTSAMVGVEPFYIIPARRYEFSHPRGTQNASSHFRSVWVVWLGKRTTEVLQALQTSSKKPYRFVGEKTLLTVAHPGAASSGFHSQQQAAAGIPLVARGLSELQSGNITAPKRSGLNQRIRRKKAQGVIPQL